MGNKLWLEIEYNVKTDKYTIISNIKDEQLKEVMFEWLRSQLGAGQGQSISQANELEVYHIRIELDLDGDIFTVKSDTGNESLTCGIVWHVLGKMQNGGVAQGDGGNAT